MAIKAVREQLKSKREDTKKYGKNLMNDEFSFFYPVKSISPTGDCYRNIFARFLPLISDQPVAIAYIVPRVSAKARA